MNPLPPKTIHARQNPRCEKFALHLHSFQIPFDLQGGAGLVLLENHARFTEITLQFTGF